MKVTAIKTKKVYPKDDLLSLLLASLPPLREKQILAISGKILSLCYGYFIKKEIEPLSKESLVQREADCYWKLPNREMTALTLKGGCFLPFAGIDESNGAGTYVLFPKNLFSHTASIWSALRRHYELQTLGVLIIDSHLTPLRRGTTGICLSWCGCSPLHSYRGEKDCFSRAYTMTHLNLIDAYATAAVAEMGEGNEQTPIALIEEATKAQFIDRPPNEEERESIAMHWKEDLFYPLFHAANKTATHHNTRENQSDDFTSITH